MAQRDDEREDVSGRSTVHCDVCGDLLHDPLDHLQWHLTIAEVAQPALPTPD